MVVLKKNSLPRMAVKAAPCPSWTAVAFLQRVDSLRTPVAARPNVHAPACSIIGRINARLTVQCVPFGAKEKQRPKRAETRFCGYTGETVRHDQYGREHCPTYGYVGQCSFLRIHTLDNVL